MEWFNDLAKNESRVWLDGQERASLHWQNNGGSNLTYPAQLQSWSVGWYEAHGPIPDTDDPWDVWIDEVVLDRNRIGCEN